VFCGLSRCYIDKYLIGEADTKVKKIAAQMEESALVCANNGWQGQWRCFMYGKVDCG
jgi:hypothetical protein